MMTTHELTKASAVVHKGEGQSNGGFVACRHTTSYVDWQGFKAYIFISNLFSKTELLLHHCIKHSNACMNGMEKAKSFV